MAPEDTTGRAATVWDPVRYVRFEAERARPFHDLLARIPDVEVRAAADLGCGTGSHTRLLQKRWPAARVWGVDNSAPMLERARAEGAGAGPRFVEADLARWRPPHPLDCIVSNAALHWVPDHADLLAKLASDLEEGGVLAVQVPNNRAEPAYRVLDGLIAGSRWAGLLPARVLDVTVETPEWYADRLHELGFAVELWETVYHHQLPDPASIVDWLAGTTLRPVLSLLTVAEADEFLAELRREIGSHYRPRPCGVIFPFRRLFFVAVRSR